MKFTPGPLVGAASGSIGGTTASRNRYGAYLRVRAIPVTATTQPALQAKARLSDVSADWRGLTDPQRASWRTYAQTNPIIDALGQQQVLAPNAAYIGINTRLDVAGATHLDDPPVAAAPEALLTVTGTYDIGAGTSEIAFSASPLGAAESLWVKAAVVDSAGIKYVENLYKLVHISAVALATPYDFVTDVEARFGTLLVGQQVHFKVHVFDEATGLLGAPRIISGTIVST